ncbi:hypothetical protein FA048_06995 [Pedobacter polaris]|uniref:ABC transporter permease n=1 Tax=Pedobacter polaris TaxID=2571273 RepID=A0A4U1CSD9_9SPHI|nr:ABC transporter permease [Pedobacter polaris]TKC09950.1 hypothetical protein FA048_06995 [Pedobacter polaris]
MSLAISLRSEFLKTKRSPSWILTLVMAAFVPLFMLLVIKESHDGHLSDDIAKISKEGWNFYFYQGIGMISFLFLPMFVILISTLLPQIEYRNHTWKQVFASPQSLGKLYLSKFLVFQFFILVFLIASLLLIGISCVFSGMLNPKFNYNSHALDWQKLLAITSKTYIAILALSTIQFWMGLRFKSFLLPMGVGVLCYILGIINMVGYHVVDADKYFYTFSGFIFIKQNAAKVPYVLWSSAAYATVILLLGFLDFSRAKER